MTPFLRISLFMALVVVAISSQAQENVGIGTKTPTNTLHISPITPGANDPLRVDGFMQYSNNDTTVLVVNPTSGVIRYIPFSTLGNILGGNSGTDNQNLDSARLIGNTLEIFIENGNSASVDLSSIGGGTDDQVLDSARLVGSTLEIYLENGGNTSVDLSSLAGADDQNLDSAKLVGNVLEIYIEDGNSTSVDLSAILGSDDQMIDSVKLNNSFLEIYLENGGLGAVDLSPISSSDDQVLDSARLVGSILEIYLENGGNANVDLSSLSGGSDDQNLDSAKLVGNILEIYIEDGNSTSVDLSSISSSNDNDWTLDGDTLYSAPDSAVVIKGGNVGIGTTDPNNALDIEFSLDGTLSSEVYNTSSHPDAVARMVVRSAGNRSWILGNYHTGYNGSFGSYFANKMMLTNAGDLSVNPDIAIYNRS
ncbi:MAG: hypothetical protein MRY83_03255, partial [Flavobacteriales bacterium]|nr:hypothetical protein [Flavobacteriales bacterium]